MSERHLDDWIDSYLKYTDNSEPKESYRKWAAISAIASVLQRKVRLPFGMLTFFPNMYIVLVGPPAACKGTAVAPASKMLDALGVSMAADESSRQKLIDRLCKADASHTDKEGNTYFHCSLTIWASELTTFLGFNNMELFSDLNKWFDCEDRFTYDTHLHGLQEVMSVWVNMLGCTTPDLLQQSMPQTALGSGFTSRTVFVYEENRGKIVIWPSGDDALKELLIQDLGKILTMCGTYKFEEGVISTYGEWRQLGIINPPTKDPHLAYYLQRRHVHLLKLCMIFSASRSNDFIINSIDLNRAIKTLEYAESKMPLVFKGMGANPLGRVQLQIMKTIGDEKVVSISELMQLYHDEVGRDSLGKVIQTLIAMNYCKPDYNVGTLTYIEST